MSEPVPASPAWRRAWPFVIAAAILLALDIARFAVLPAHRQDEAMNGFEALVAVLVAAACARAAHRSLPRSRGRWSLATAYFVLLAIADSHDLLLGLAPANRSAVHAILETLGWGTYLPLALLVFYPLGDSERSPWSTLSILDFAQVTLVLGVAYFHFIYLPHALSARSWQVMDRPDVVRNVLIAAGLALRAAIDPASRARRFYRWIAGTFASMMLLLVLFRRELAPIAQVGRPGCFLAFGIFAALWNEPETAVARLPRATLPRWVLGSLPLAGPLVVIGLAPRTPLPWAAWIPVAVVASLALFAARISLAERDRQAKQDALRDSEAQLRAFVAHAPYGITRLSPGRDRLLSANPALVRMLAYDSEEQLCAASLSRGLFVHAEDCAGFCSALATHEQIQDFESRWRRRDGEVVTLRVSGRRADAGTDVADAVEAIVEDVTERRRIDRELRQAHKMEAVGRLAGGVAHEFNNLLAIILGYSDLLRDLASGQDALRQPLREIRRASEHAASLTRQLLAFGRKETTHPQLVSLNAIVRDTEHLLRKVLGETIEVAVSLADEDPGIFVDRNQMEQVVVNLALNARDAMSAGGRVTIATAVAEGAEPSPSGAASRPDGPWATLTITDTGVGIPEDIRERIFEPFFTTKPRGEGTGLGLAVIYGIVQEAGGRIDVTSEVGQGTSFRISLPHLELPGDRRDTPRQPVPVGGTETILLVEDSEPVRRLLRELLESSGYVVLEAADGESALRLARESAAAIDLLVTDVVMPGLGGVALAEHVRALRPATRVLLVSGYAEPKVSAASRLGREAAFLRKPFRHETLAAAVRAALDGDRSESDNRCATSRDHDAREAGMARDSGKDAQRREADTPISGR